MRIKYLLSSTFSLSLLALVAQPALGQLYSQDFDADDTANWTVNGGAFGVDPTDFNADFFFDYSTIGIPSAPNSTGGTTRGVKMQANLFSGAFGGGSVSPTGESFSGDYVLSYDMWQSYQGVEFFPPSGIFPATGGILRGAASGTTNIGYGGILTSGTSRNEAGTSDGVFFAATQDGDSGADYRAYSSDKPVSYQPNALPPSDQNFDARDLDATYFAVGGSAPADFDGSQRVNGADFLDWQRGVGEFDAVTTFATKADGDANADDLVDGADLSLWEFWYGRDFKTRNAATSTLYTDNFGGESPTADQTLLFPDEFAQHPDNVTDIGVIGFAWRQHTITKIGDIVTWAVDGIDLIEVDTSNFTTPVGGSNILFGHSDTNSGVSGNATAFDLLLTLVDNVKVEAIPASAGAHSVPEPATWLSALIGMLTGGLFSRRRLATQLVINR